MSADGLLLPDRFAALEPFADRWAGENAAERAHLRGAFPAQERDAFYAACRPLVAQALAELDAKPLSTLNEREQRLMRLMLTFAHVSLAVEVQQADEPAHTALREHMRIVRAPADVD